MILLLIQVALALLNLLPIAVRIGLLTFMIRAVVFFLPKYRRIALKNLAQVFPEQTPSFRRDILSRSDQSLARLLVDFARLPQLSQAWVSEHVDSPGPEFLNKIKQDNPDKGLLIATGHLGSFELLAHSIAVAGYPVSFIAREFSIELINRWWWSIREAKGNRTIARKGAFKKVVQELNAGGKVAILFDQNVTRNHAVFIPFFGRPAATTKSLGLAALKTRCPVMVSSIRYVGDDHYKVEAVSLDFKYIYDDPVMAVDQKVFEITKAISLEFEKMILNFPEGWFWMHRRWKTTQVGVEERFYDS